MNIIKMVETAVEERRALDYFGGFEAYQEKLYNALRDKLRGMSVEQMIAMEKWIFTPKEHLRLSDFVGTPHYVYYHMGGGALCRALNVDVLSLLGKRRELSLGEQNYWQIRIGKELGIGSCNVLDPHLAMTAVEESDARAEKLTKKGVKPNFAVSN